MEQHQEVLPGIITQHPADAKLPQFLRTLAGRCRRKTPPWPGSGLPPKKHRAHTKESWPLSRASPVTGGPVVALAPADLLEEALLINSSNLARFRRPRETRIRLPGGRGYGRQTQEIRKSSSTSSAPPRKLVRTPPSQTRRSPSRSSAIMVVCDWLSTTMALALPRRT